MNTDQEFVLIRAGDLAYIVPEEKVSATNEGLTETGFQGHLNTIRVRLLTSLSIAEMDSGKATYKFFVYPDDGEAEITRCVPKASLHIEGGAAVLTSGPIWKNDQAMVVIPDENPTDFDAGSMCNLGRLEASVIASSAEEALVSGKAVLIKEINRQIGWLEQARILVSGAAVDIQED